MRSACCALHHGTRLRPLAVPHIPSCAVPLELQALPAYPHSRLPARRLRVQGLSKFFSPETVLSTMCGSPQ